MENKLRKCNAFLLRQGHRARQFLKNCVCRSSRGGEAIPPEMPYAPPVTRLSPLERIQMHLRQLGLSHVHARFAADGVDFILEDADGYVHAKDYREAVVLIERIWLYQP